MRVDNGSHQTHNVGCGVFPMSTDNAQAQQQKIQEFIRLLPLTFELAGLAKNISGSYFNEGQLEARATAIKNAYKAARLVIVDVAK